MKTFKEFSALGSYLKEEYGLSYLVVRRGAKVDGKVLAGAGDIKKMKGKTPPKEKWVKTQSFDKLPDAKAWAKGTKSGSKAYFIANLQDGKFTGYIS